MAVTIVDFPDIVPDSTEWGLITNTRTFTSPLTGDTQTASLLGAKWSASLVFNNMTQAEATIMKGFLLKLRGSAGRFRLYDHVYAGPQGSASNPLAYPVVSGGGQEGNSLDVAGFQENTTAFYPGEYFQIGDELKMITNTALVDGSGFTTLEFEPALRKSYAHLTRIYAHTPTPTCIMRLTDDEQARWVNSETILLSSLTINCIEAFFNG